MFLECVEGSIVNSSKYLILDEIFDYLFIVVFITYWFYFSYNSKVMDSIVAKDYKLSKKLGSGAFGEVFLAINIKNHAEYAVKL